jgi:hypothetical protein
MRSGPGAVLGAFGFITVAGMTFGTPAQAKDVTVGVMTCDTASSFGYVLGSSRDLNCTFVPESGTPEHYAGTISKFGVDIGYVQSAVIVWTAVALPPGSLTGTYGGATASVTVGVGANVRVGGSNHTVSLQPVSIEGGTGPQYRRWFRLAEPDFSARLARQKRVGCASSPRRGLPLARSMSYWQWRRCHASRSTRPRSPTKATTGCNPGHTVRSVGRQSRGKNADPLCPPGQRSRSGRAPVHA